MKKWFKHLEYHWRWGLIGMLLIGSCTTVPITGRNRLDFVPDSQIVSMAAENYSTLLKESKLSNDSQKVASLKRVGSKIAQAAEAFMRESGLEGDLQYYAWEYNLIEDDKTANAFCMPGGKIAFYTGIFPMTQDDAGIAVVMGHEVAHAIAKHGNERMSQAMLTELGATALSVAVKEQPEKTQTIFMQAFGIGTQVGVLLPYSRKHETEADRIGLILMARAGYDPKTAIHFWERMSQQEGGVRPPELLSTHPAPDTRINDLNGFLPEAMSYYVPGKKP